MTQHVNPENATQKPPRPKRAKLSLERIMLILIGFFALGIFLLVLFPEDHPGRGAAMLLYVLLLFWTFFRF